MSSSRVQLCFQPAETLSQSMPKPSVSTVRLEMADRPRSSSITTTCCVGQPSVDALDTKAYWRCVDSRLCSTWAGEDCRKIDVSGTAQMRGADLCIVTHRRLRLIGRLAGLRNDACQNAERLGACFGRRGAVGSVVIASVGEVRERPGSAASQLSSSAAGCGIRQRPMRASAILRAWSKSASDARQESRRSDRDCGGFLGGRCPVCPTGGNERAAAVRKHHQQQQCAAALEGRHNRQRPPSNGCRSRRIVTALEMSRRWVVCGNFLRQHGP